MRVAEQEHRRLLVGALRLEVGPVHLKTAWFVATESQQTTLQHLAAIVADAGEEAVVVGRQDEHPLAGHCQRLDGYRHGRYDARGIEYFLTTDSPLVAALEPGDDGVVIVVANMGVAEDRMLRALSDSFLYSGGHLKIHIGYPEGDGDG